MFEDSDEFQDERMYFDSVPEFKMLSCIVPTEEVGIRFSGEIAIDDSMSVITDKTIPLSDVEETVKTYQKVMEIRELTEDEILHINKWRLVFKKLFDVFFRGKKWRVFYTAFCSCALAIDIDTNNILGILLMTLCILCNTSPIKFAKELPKIFASSEKVEQLKAEIDNKEIVSTISSIPDDEGIQLYLKPKMHM